MEMKTRLYRKAFLAISFILIIPALITLLSCGLLPKDRKEKEIYTILDMVLSEIKSQEKKDSIFINSTRMHPETIMKYIVSEAKQILRYQKMYSIKKIASDSSFSLEYIIDDMSDPKEIAYLKKQSEIPFKIDLQKITSNEHFFNYKKPVKRLDERGIVIGTRELYADYSRAVYYISRPVFTSDGMYSILVISQRDGGGWVWMYKKRNKDWIYLRSFWLYFE